jgi:hypothetical protein
MQLMGGTLEEAAAVAVTIRATTNLGERSTERSCNSSTTTLKVFELAM